MEPENELEVHLPVAKKDMHMEFSVQYIALPRHVAVAYMNRKNDELYKKYCGKLFQLPLFPLQMDRRKSKNREYHRLSRIVTAVRVRRLVIL